MIQTILVVRQSDALEKVVANEITNKDDTGAGDTYNIESLLEGLPEIQNSGVRD